MNYGILLLCPAAYKFKRRTRMPSYSDEMAQARIERIYSTYKDLLYRYAFKILKNEPDASDSVQNTLLRLIRVIDRISSYNDSMLKIYLLTIVKNTSFDILKENKKRKHLPLDEYAESCTEQITFEDLYIEQLDNQGNIREILRLLKREYADIITLKYYCELDDKTIMKMLNINHINLRVRLHRARNAVKSLEAKRSSCVVESLGGYE